MNLRPMTAAALAAAVLVSSLLAAPASAAPPVTVDDEVTMWAADLGFGEVTADVLANDSDPDGDTLALCRVGEVPADAPYFADVVGDQIMVFVLGEVTSPITITYYACDFETLVPGTLTVTLNTTEPIRVTKTDKPGVLRVTNPNDLQIGFLWGGPKESRADGRVRVPADDSVFVRVHRHRIIWVALIGRYSPIDIGRVRDIVLPRDDRGTAALRPGGQRPRQKQRASA